MREILTRDSGVKVTVRKAAARLAACHLPPGSAAALLSTVARSPGVHPDVHATIVGLAPQLLPAEEMWSLLESAAEEGPDPSRSILLEQRPTDLALVHRPRYAALIARLPAVADEWTAEQALSCLPD